MELMPAWKRWGYEEGMEKGKAEERAALVRRMLAKGFTPQQVADTLEIPLSEVEQLEKY